MAADRANGHNGTAWPVGGPLLGLPELPASPGVAGPGPDWTAAVGGVSRQPMLYRKVAGLKGGREVLAKVHAPGTVLLVAASVLLAALAGAMGYVSWRAQFAFIHSTGKANVPSAIEALGLDAAAAIFAFLALAKARQGKGQRAHAERVLNLLCAVGSGFMNVLGGNLGSPRSIAVWLLPALLYAATSDRVVATVATSFGLGDRRSVWALAGAVALYSVRLVLAPIPTVVGLRRWVLALAPLPTATGSGGGTGRAAVILPEASARIAPSKPRKAIAGRREVPNKRARLLAAYGALGAAGDRRVGDRSKVSQVAGELAAEAGLQPGTARTYLYAECDRRAGL